MKDQTLPRVTGPRGSCVWPTSSKPPSHFIETADEAAAGTDLAKHVDILDEKIARVEALVRSTTNA